MNASAELLKELRIDRSAPPPGGPSPSRRWLWVVIGLVLALLLALAAGMLLTRKPVVSVETAPVVAMGQSGSGPNSVLDASGYVVARRMATVSAKITGKVREVMIEEGMRVEEGQVMATLDPIDANAQRSLNMAQLDAARAQTQGFQAQLRQAEADAGRLQSLVGQQLVSRSQYDQAVAARDNLRAQLLTARHNTKVAQDALAIADLGVDNNVVRAPFSGVVTAKAAQPGEIVSPLSAGGGFTRTGIGTIVDMDSLEVEVEVGEAFIGRPTADRGKATVKVRVALKVKDPRVVPEMGVRVSFLEKAAPAGTAAPKGVRVPGAAIVQRDGKPTAFVLQADNTVRAQAVQTGATLGKDKQVLAGLGVGQTVVLDPPDALKDGDKVALAGADK
jgi:multidrug efflux pump subunit AcrA (membrane-fusion protein)